MAVSVNASEQLNGTLELSVDKATGETVFVLNGVEETNLTTNGELGNGLIEHLEDTDKVSYSFTNTDGTVRHYPENRIYGAKAQSDDAIAVLAFENLSDNGGLVLERLTDTAVPQVGQATMLGDYYGYWQRGEGDGVIPLLVLYFFSGDAELSVDFADQTVSGKITDRILRNRLTNIPSSSLEFTDIVFETSTIDGFGGFAGATTGGQRTDWDDNDATLTGSFEGLLTGSNATGAIGAVEIVTIVPDGARFEGELVPLETIEVGIFSVSE